MDVGQLSLVLVLVLALVGLLLVFENRRLHAEADRARESAAADLRRAAELAHSALNAAPYKQLCELLTSTTDAAMSISGEYLAMKKQAAEAQYASNELVDARVMFLLRSMGLARAAPPTGARPEADGEIVTGGFSDVAPERRGRAATV